MKKRVVGALVVSTLVVAMLLIYLPVGANAWHLLTGKGEDRQSYYYFKGNEDMPYIKKSKYEVEKYEEFDKHDYQTWCL